MSLSLYLPVMFKYFWCRSLCSRVVLRHRHRRHPLRRVCGCITPCSTSYARTADSHTAAFCCCRQAKTFNGACYATASPACKAVRCAMSLPFHFCQDSQDGTATQVVVQQSATPSPPPPPEVGTWRSLPPGCHHTPAELTSHRSTSQLCAMLSMPASQ